MIWVICFGWLIGALASMIYADFVNHGYSDNGMDKVNCLPFKAFLGIGLFWPVFALPKLRYLTRLAKIPMYFVGSFRDARKAMR